MNFGLILIDIQREYFPGGKNELSLVEKATFQASKMLSFSRNKNLAVVHIKHINNRQGRNFFLPGTDGAEIHSLVAPSANEKVIINIVRILFLKQICTIYWKRKE